MNIKVIGSIQQEFFLEEYSQKLVIEQACLTDPILYLNKAEEDFKLMLNIPHKNTLLDKDTMMWKGWIDNYNTTHSWLDFKDIRVATQKEIEIMDAIQTARKLIKEIEET